LRYKYPGLRKSPFNTLSRYQHKKLRHVSAATRPGDPCFGLPFSAVDSLFVHNGYLRIMKTVLLVDDSRDLVFLYCKMLSMLGYAPLAAQGGKECQELLDEKVPDLILLDVMMEPVDGWETLRQIRKRADLLMTPVIMLTARSPQPRDILYCGDFLDGYIMKPVTKSNLEKKLNALWERYVLIQDNMQKLRSKGISPADTLDYLRAIRACISLTNVMEALNPFRPSGFEGGEPDGTVNEEIVRIRARLQEKKEKIRGYHALL
jgi:two-component system OmpR family response regulator